MNSAPIGAKQRLGGISLVGPFCANAIGREQRDQEYFGILDRDGSSRTLARFRAAPSTGNAHQAPVATCEWPLLCRQERHQSERTHKPTHSGAWLLPSSLQFLASQLFDRRPTHALQLMRSETPGWYCRSLSLL